MFFYGKRESNFCRNNAVKEWFGTWVLFPRILSVLTTYFLIRNVPYVELSCPSIQCYVRSACPVLQMWDPPSSWNISFSIGGWRHSLVSVPLISHGLAQPASQRTIRAANPLSYTLTHVKTESAPAIFCRLAFLYIKTASTVFINAQAFHHTKGVVPKMCLEWHHFLTVCMFSRVNLFKYSIQCCKSHFS